MKKEIGVAALVSLFAFELWLATARADEPALPPDPPARAAAPLPGPWSGDVAIGYVRTSGNTKTSSLNAKLGLNYKGVAWGNELMGSAYSGSRDQQTTDERYSLADKVNYNLSPKGYLFGNGSYDNDRFAGVAVRYVVTAGYGRHVIATPTQTLDLEAGLGGNRTHEQDAEHFTSRAIATFGGRYVWKITPTSQFSQTLRTEYASNNLYVNPIAELKLSVIGNLFAALDYELRYNTGVPVGIRHVDPITPINLGYGFGKT